MRIWREKAGVISEGTCWVAVHREHMYTSLWFVGLLWEMATSWKNDRHLWG